MENNYPEASRWLKNIVTEYKWADETTGCCRVSYKKLTEDDTAVCVCNNCMAMLDESASNHAMDNIWMLIDATPNFPLPDYKGKKMGLQDCGRAFDRTDVQDAVRSLMKKMNIQIVELPDAREKSIFCGPSFLKSAPKIDASLAPKRYGEGARERGFFKDYSPEEFERLMKEHCERIPVDEVVCYCAACDAGLEMGEKTVVHLLDLVADTA